VFKTQTIELLILTLDSMSLQMKSAHAATVLDVFVNCQRI